MTNCRHLQILVTNLDNTTTTYTFNVMSLNISCIINSSYKYLDSAGQLLDASKLTNIKKHTAYDSSGTYMYTADERPGFGSCFPTPLIRCFLASAPQCNGELERTAQGFTPCVQEKTETSCNNKYWTSNDSIYYRCNWTQRK